MGCLTSSKAVLVYLSPKELGYLDKFVPARARSRAIRFLIRESIKQGTLDKLSVNSFVE